MDLAIFAATLLASGMYVNRDTKKVRRETVRSDLPPYEKLSNVNVFGNDTWEESQKRLTSVYENHGKQVAKYTNKLDMSTAPLNTFEEFPFNERPYIRGEPKQNVTPGGGLRMLERMGNSTQHTLWRSKREKEMDGPVRSDAVAQVDFLDVARQHQDRVYSGNKKEGVRLEEQVRDTPIVDGTLRIVPKSSDQLYANNAKNNLEYDRTPGASNALIVKPALTMPLVRKRPAMAGEEQDLSQFTQVGSNFKANRGRETEFTQTPSNNILYSSEGFSGGGYKKMPAKSGESRLDKRLVQFDPSVYAAVKAATEATMDRQGVQEPVLTQRNMTEQRMATWAGSSELQRPMADLGVGVKTTSKDTLLHDRSAGHATAMVRHETDQSEYTAKTTMKEMNLSERVGPATRPALGDYAVANPITSVPSTLKESLMTERFGSRKALVEEPISRDSAVASKGKGREVDSYAPVPSGGSHMVSSAQMGQSRERTAISNTLDREQVPNRSGQTMQSGSLEELMEQYSVKKERPTYSVQM